MILAEQVPPSGAYSLLASIQALTLIDVIRRCMISQQVQVNDKSSQNSNGTDVLSTTSAQISMNKIIDIKLPTNDFVGAMLMNNFAIGQVYDA